MSEKNVDIPINAYGVRCPFCGILKFAHQYEVRSGAGEYVLLGNQYGYMQSFFSGKIAKCPKCRNEMPADMLALYFYGNTSEYCRVAYIGVSDYSKLSVSERVWYDKSQRQRIVFLILAKNTLEALRDDSMESFKFFDYFELYVAVEPEIQNNGIEAATALANKLSEILIGRELPKQMHLYLCYGGDLENDIKRGELSVEDYHHWKRYLSVYERLSYCYSTHYRIKQYNGPEIPKKRLKKLIKYVEKKINKLSA